jgi:hypothetical protein
LKYAKSEELDELLTAFRTQQELIAADIVLNEIRSRKTKSNPEPELSTPPVPTPSVASPVQSKAEIEKARKRAAEQAEIRRVRIESNDGRVIPRCKEPIYLHTTRYDLFEKSRPRVKRDPRSCTTCTRDKRGPDCGGQCEVAGFLDY